MARYILGNIDLALRFLTGIILWFVGLSKNLPFLQGFGWAMFLFSLSDFLINRQKGGVK